MAGDTATPDHRRIRRSASDRRNNLRPAKRFRNGPIRQSASPPWSSPPPTAPFSGDAADLASCSFVLDGRNTRREYLGRVTNARGRYGLRGSLGKSDALPVLAIRG